MTGNTFNIGDVSGTGNNFGDNGRIENHIQPEATQATPGQLLTLLADLDERIAANAVTLPNAAELTEKVAKARQELETSSMERRHLISVRSLLAAVVTGAVGVTVVTDAVQHIMRLLGHIEAP